MCGEVIEESPLFWHVHKNRSAAQPGQVPSIETSDNRREQYLMNMVSGVRLSI